MSPRDELSDAIETTISRYAAMVRQIGRGHGLRDDDVDAVMQDVRIRLWKALGSGEKIRRVSTSYLYRTAVSAALDVIRRQRVRAVEAAAPLEASTEAAIAHLPTPEQAMADAELRAELERMMNGLRASRRPVVRMYLAGYSREEIAALLGWTEAKTRNLLYRGLAELRLRLVERGIHPEAAR